MAGGEFCGNATRCVAYLSLNSQPGEIKIAVSGTNQILKAGINPDLTVWAQMPIIKSFSCIKQIDDLTIVNLEGITHVITYSPNKNVEALKTHKQIKFLKD